MVSWFGLRNNGLIALLLGAAVFLTLLGILTRHSKETGRPREAMLSDGEAAWINLGDRTMDRWLAQEAIGQLDIPDLDPESQKRERIRLRLSNCRAVSYEYLGGALMRAREPIPPEADEILEPVDCYEADVMPKAFHDMEIPPVGQQGYLIYDDGMMGKDRQQILNWQDVIPDMDLFDFMKYRLFTLQSELAENSIIPILDFELRNVVEFTLGIPARARDLQSSPIVLVSLWLQTELPREIVFCVSVGTLKTDAPQVKAFAHLLDAFFPDLKGKKILVIPEPSNPGANRQAAAELSDLPFFSFFDIDDFLHPLWFQVMNKSFLDYPEYDLLLVHPGLGWIADCSIETYVEALKAYIKTGPKDLEEAHRSIYEDPLKRIPMSHTSDHMETHFTNVFMGKFNHHHSWYLGRPEAEPQRDGPQRTVNFAMPSANGWQTGRRWIRKNVPIVQGLYGEDVLWNFRVMAAGFDVAVVGFFDAAYYAYRPAHEACELSERARLARVARGETVDKAPNSIPQPPGPPGPPPHPN